MSQNPEPSSARSRPASLRWSTAQTWAAIGAERAALAADLTGLAAAQWRQPTLCDRWSVEEVVAHLTAGASTTGPAWIRSVIAARFDFARHNDARLAEQLGDTPAETLRRFRAAAGSRRAPFGTPALGWLGETVIHAHDIRRPLGIDSPTPVSALTELARFLARTDFTVASRTTAKGLRLTATDGPFDTGTGPRVGGTTLALTMVLAGRVAFADELAGPGLDTLRAQCLAAT
ncbi:maleylpyruvate isomerase family mycothiol-dependent enzyme [Microlunatus speluncae]|uniref:maleylpyruvate isomerase family mycothiol-dependent enzyme n=1 Tax=Microlunatus speluncae TaxID=2594267 RepID=UPI0012666E7E|nr:maleylpyruvate isomerase family mycothiol-dependent enzyme [Microlunatus speluncae]